MIARLVGFELTGLFLVHSLNAGKNCIGDRLSDIQLIKRGVGGSLIVDGGRRRRNRPLQLIKAMVDLFDRGEDHS